VQRPHLLRPNVQPLYEKAARTAIVRVELLSPLPHEEILRIIASYTNAKRVIWVQEEPKNMGARAHVRRRLVERLPNGLADIDYVGPAISCEPVGGLPGSARSRAGADCARGAPTDVASKTLSTENMHCPPGTSSIHKENTPHLCGFASPGERSTCPVHQARVRCARHLALSRAIVVESQCQRRKN